MVLANFNVEHCLIEQIKNYLNATRWTFEQLKNLILNAKSIPEICILFDARLSQAEANDLKEARHKLEAESRKKQAIEDENEHKNDLLKKTKDKQLKERFNQELKKTSSSIEEHLNEQQALTQRMNQSTVSQIALGRNLAYPQGSRWQYELQQQEMKLHFLYEKRKLISYKIQAIEKRESLYKQKEEARNAREQAGRAYENTQQNIEQSLTEKNKAQLKKDSEVYSQSLNKKKSQLNQNAEQIHFSLFLQQLIEHLPQMQLGLTEKTALQAIIKLSQKRLQYKNDLSLFQSSFTKKKSLISKLLVQLHGAKDKLRLLAKQNPTASNEEIAEKIKTLDHSLEQNKKINKRLNTFSLLFLGLSCLFSIPLILVLNGTISFFTPILMYCLVSIPPALFLLSTIGLMISSLVYFFKNRADTEAIKNNKLQISSNFKQENKKELDAKELELVLLPKLEEQIKKEENLRDELGITIEKTHKLINDTLAQAQAVTPTSMDNLSWFKTNPHESKIPDFDIAALLPQYVITRDEASQHP